MKRGAYETLQITRHNPGKRFPNEEDPRFRDDPLFPSSKPKFTPRTPAKVFTIVSCFARNIGLALQDYDVELPTMDFAVPKTDRQVSPQGLPAEGDPVDARA